MLQFYFKFCSVIIMAANVEFEFRDAAFSRRMLTFAIVNREHIDIKQFLDEAFEYYQNEIQSVLQVSTSVKVNTCLATTFKKNVIVTDDAGENSDDDDEPRRSDVRRELQDIYIQTNNITVQRKTNLRAVYEKYVTGAILKQIDDVITKDRDFRCMQSKSWWFK